MATRAHDLDTPLLQLTNFDYWHIRDSLMHQLVLGTTGSGKSSGTMKHTILAMAKAGFGLLFCIAKPEDATFVKTLSQQAGRAGSIVEITETQGAFNFLAWAMARSGNINEAIDLLDHAIEIIRSSGPASGRAGDEFWTSAKTAMLRATIPAIWAATGTVRIKDVIAFIRSAPSSAEQMQDPKWQQGSAFFRTFCMAAERLEQGLVPGFDDEVAELSLDYWREIAALDAKTAGNIRITLTTTLSRFQTGLLKRMFCGDTDVVPELLFHAGILILNIPVQVFGEDGAIAQKIWKFCTQRACLTRNALDERQSKIPVGIIADEAQNFTYLDAEFLAQCRSSLVSVVFATQSLPTLYAKIGGDHPHDRAHHLISNFNTLVLHSSACPETNEWFSRKIGKSLQQRANYSQGEGSNSSFGMNMSEGENWGRNSGTGSSYGGSSGGGQSGSNWSHSTNSGSSSGGSDNRGLNRGSGTSSNVSHGYSEQMDDILTPGFFASALKTGGPQSGNRVSAVWFSAGKKFRASNGNCLLVEFEQ